MVEAFDVVVIGSGAGGAPIAATLALADRDGQPPLRVLVLEKGPMFRTQGERGEASPSDFKRDELFNVGHERIISVPGVANFGQPFYSGRVEPDLNDEPHLYSKPGQEHIRIATIEGYTAQVIGGGTQLYGAVSLRFTEDDFRLRTYNDNRTYDLPFGTPADTLDHVIDWPVTYAEMEPYYFKAETLVGLNGEANGQAKPFPVPRDKPYQRPLTPNPISAFAHDGMTSLGFTAYRTPLAVITEDHLPSGRTVDRAIEAPKTGYVNRYGCPIGYKSNTWVALLRPAQQGLAARGESDRLQIRCNCNVTHLVSNGRRVTEVVYRDPVGEEKRVSGKVVVVACSAIETVRLLMLSAENDRNGFGGLVRYDEPAGMLGRYFLTHCFGGAEIRVPADRRVDKSVSLDSDWATDACALPEFLRERQLWAGGAIYNNTSDQALPISMAANHRSADLDSVWTGFAGDLGLRGPAMANWIEADWGRRLSVSFMANQLPRPENHVKLGDYTDHWGRKVAHIIKDWHPHDGYVMTVLADMCRQILDRGVGLGHGDHAIESGSVYGSGVRIANHVLGGCRFGPSREVSVLDRNCRVWDADNLYVTDGSFMPTSGGANPTLTIQANAFRVADHLLASGLL